MSGDRPAAAGRKQTNRTTRTTNTARTNRSNAYSLAGPHPPQRVVHGDPHNTYYEEGYRDVNPWMANESNSNFSLAGTFPHNIRWGKKKPKQNEPKVVEDPERVGTEAAPQVDEAVNQGRGEVRRNESYLSQHPAEGIEPFKRAESVRTLDSETSTGIPEAATSNPTQPQVRYRQVEAYQPNGENLGTIADEPVVQPVPKDKPFNVWANVRLHFQRPLAEWLGTTIFMFIGICGNLSVITSDFQTGTMQSTYWCWGFAVMLAIYIAGGGSGAFLNPALTIMLSVFRGFPTRRIPVYVLAQLLGAFTGSLLAFAIYRDNILHLSGSLYPEATGIAFYTQPKDWVSNSTAFFTEMLGTAVIGCSIMALGDSHNSPPGAGMHAFIIGLLTTTVTMALGYSTGGCFNPVRDLGPRLATIVVGYPTSSFTARQNWWIWGPCCATVTGALLGGLVYDLCIFKGGESPVNYSFDRWKIGGLKEERDLTSLFGFHRKAADIEKRLESGELGDHESNSQISSRS